MRHKKSSPLSIPFTYYSLGLVLFILISSGCTSPKKLVGTGEIVESPHGYVKLCTEQPKHPACNWIPERKEGATK